MQSIKSTRRGDDKQTKSDVDPSYYMFIYLFIEEQQKQWTKFCVRGLVLAV